MVELKTALTTISSLKDHKSSMEPPPLAIISKSGCKVRGSLLKPSIALDISSADVSPWTLTGQIIKCVGQRSEIR